MDGSAEQFLVFGSDLFDGREVVLIPGIESRILIADRDQFRLGVDFRQVAPAGGGTGEFAAHQARADDSEFDCFHGDSFRDIIDRIFHYC